MPVPSLISGTSNTARWLPVSFSTHDMSHLLSGRGNTGSAATALWGRAGVAPAVNAAPAANCSRKMRRVEGIGFGIWSEDGATCELSARAL